VLPEVSARGRPIDHSIGIRTKWIGLPKAVKIAINSALGVMTLGDMLAKMDATIACRHRSESLLGPRVSRAFQHPTRRDLMTIVPLFPLRHFA
jgi:hypothetical protein